ncbi:hypothetical protein FHS89_001057 [Rubricella aquisinus]|uniref:Uncharacterized protein n=1 Tax=Rubricella aquisinus TaxID=2028108 RepID=A0A840X2Z6_9RHOB|nr:hypothetical protein [Rubricella aquisinus]
MWEGAQQMGAVVSNPTHHPSILQNTFPKMKMWTCADRPDMTNHIKPKSTRGETPV